LCFIYLRHKKTANWAVYLIFIDKEFIMKCNVRLPFTDRFVVVKGCRPGESKDSVVERYYKAQARAQAKRALQKPT
jgi:hypothetical protein